MRNEEYGKRSATVGNHCAEETSGFLSDNLLTTPIRIEPPYSPVAQSESPLWVFLSVPSAREAIAATFPFLTRFRRCSPDCGRVAEADPAVILPGIPVHARTAAQTLSLPSFGERHLKPGFPGH